MPEGYKEAPTPYLIPRHAVPRRQLDILLHGANAILINALRLGPHGVEHELQFALGHLGQAIQALVFHDSARGLVRGDKEGCQETALMAYRIFRRPVTAAKKAFCGERKGGGGQAMGRRKGTKRRVATQQKVTNWRGNVQQVW